MRRLWQLFWRPSTKYGLGVLLVIGGIGGVIFWGGFNTAMEATNTMGFCITCHEMEANVYEEYKKTVHYQNASGVRATCSDCHVPKDWTHKFVRKVYATRELYHHFVGTIDTPEKFEAHRPEMAKRVWASMEATDSRECRNCHTFEAMDFTKQSTKAAQEMSKAHQTGQGTCIDCHKGIAHKMPDLSAGFKKTFEDLQALAQISNNDADVLYTIATTSAYLSADEIEAGGRGAGTLLPATGLKVLERKGDALKVRLEGWQQDGADRVIYARMGHRIFEAALTPGAIEQVQRRETLVDTNTDLTWHQVDIDLWVGSGNMIADPDRLWAYGEEMHVASCSTCHSLHEADGHLANQWIGVIKAMERFITLDKEETRMLQKYLQLHASDVQRGS
ncbi:pentaheme c-type cytochrome TorC [Hoeflea prorocentri]|uniref:Cytochrome c-type protein n=1 Tax=Hoeflea prorocentri TaxID=1922333 RepID=A0A9X3ZID1_9HYPH|nr:pentaheme c-type cytochrome TorC [Hoeflea prorocentri]MCY6382797.1 pentaheme c-type cytochrome TorC [Hoeflea prorocentri]MDA5400597.1 pentaheme c-type cytochrome TorC [Hoeflea prorocentri]